MKAIIIATGSEQDILPLTAQLPAAMLPVMNKPLIGHTVRLLASHGFTAVKICANYFPELIDEYLQQSCPEGLKISFSLEKKNNGVIASVKRIESFIDQSVLVIPANIYTDIDLAAMMQHHATHDAQATFALSRNIKKTVNGFASVDQLGKLTSTAAEKGELSDPSPLTGIAILEPAAVSSLTANGVPDSSSDIAAQLIHAQLPVFAYRTLKSSIPVHSVSDLYDANIFALEEFVQKNGKAISTGTDVEIPASVLERAGSPIVIGSSVSIAKGVSLEGPLVIGDNVAILRDAVLRHSIIMNETFIGENVEINNAVVRHNLFIDLRQQFGTFVPDAFLLSKNIRKSFQNKISSFLIAAFDRTVAAGALLFLSLPFLFVAIAIKLDSHGPVFYISRRTRKPEIYAKHQSFYRYEPEQNVKYIVFRTMYTDAAERLKDLETANVYDSGPFRKIKNDPRVTKVGRMLRKTSIDELPLLWNVLKGEMSLVGIWALPGYEASDLMNKGMNESGVDLSDTAKIRFEGTLGLAGLWQARGRSNLSAEERALHDSFQALPLMYDGKMAKQLGEHGGMSSFRGYLKLLIETAMAVLKKKGAM